MRRLETTPALPQSVQDTSVLPGFTSDGEVLRAELRCHLHRACRRMRKDGCFCTVAGIMLRTKDFAVVSDKVKLPAASDAEFYIAGAVLPLLKTSIIREFSIAAAGSYFPDWCRGKLISRNCLSVCNSKAVRFLPPGTRWKTNSAKT